MAICLYSNLRHIIEKDAYKKSSLLLFSPALIETHDHLKLGLKVHSYSYIASFVGRTERKKNSENICCFETVVIIFFFFKGF